MTPTEANQLAQEALDANPLYAGLTVYVTKVTDAGDEYRCLFDGEGLFDPLELLTIFYLD